MPIRSISVTVSSKAVRRPARPQSTRWPGRIFDPAGHSGVSDLRQLFHQRREHAHQRHRSVGHLPYVPWTIWHDRLGPGRQLQQHDVDAPRSRHKRPAATQCSADCLPDHWDTQEQDHHWWRLELWQMGRVSARDTLRHHLGGGVYRTGPNAVRFPYSYRSPTRRSTPRISKLVTT